MSLQKIKLINKIEKLTDGVESNKKLHHAKQELLYQIKTLDIAFTCQGFFKIDRAFLAEVGLSRRGDLVAIGISILKIVSCRCCCFRWPPRGALTLLLRFKHLLSDWKRTTNWIEKTTLATCIAFYSMLSCCFVNCNHFFSKSHKFLIVQCSVSTRLHVN